MTREEAIERLIDLGSIIISKNEEDKRYCHAIKLAIKALEQEPCEDAVSREAIESILYELYEVCTNMDELVHCMDDNLRKLPSVTPKQRTAEWIDDGLEGIGAMGIEYRWQKCSGCGYKFVKAPAQYYPKYCQSCGAKMQ